MLARSKGRSDIRWFYFTGVPVSDSRILFCTLSQIETNSG